MKDAMPKCAIRDCRYFQGIIRNDDYYSKTLFYCDAFPDGIPDEITYGNNLHLKPLPNQRNKIVYEKE